MAPWAWSFWRSSRRSGFQTGARALQQLAGDAVGDMQALRARIDPFELHEKALLHVALSERELVAVRHELQLLREAGYPSSVEHLDAQQARQHEPALQEGVVGALLTHGEVQVAPDTLCAALATTIAALGVEVREGEAVHDVRRDGSTWRIAAASGPLVARNVLVATGADAPALLAAAGVRAPVTAAKGYSITLPATAGAPRGPIYLHGAKIAISPYADRIRVSGMLELGSHDLGVSDGRIATLLRGVAHALPGWRLPGDGVSWAGARPLLPDGLPAIGPVAGRPGLWTAIGHGTLGVTLGPTTARILTDAIVDGAPVPGAVSAARLGPRGRRTRGSAPV
jgi:D-amino-acid dehydrogenase